MLISIQYFRAIAALFVLLSHASHKVELESSITNLFKLGNYGVDLFFIISGFVMCFSIDGKCPNPIKFMKARFIRILPLYWILTLVALIVFLFKPEIYP
ncbi:acyltransferase family protein [Vibrio fluvialis]|nr:acyltransferase family protein [Vibrio fluvialis]MBY8294983.1 acyltransferase family protein [Vibrio fluvialis]MBY8311701.1 acyltransferase family protein [Vibrio fluvialis]